MSNLTQLPDLAKVFQKIKLIDKLTEVCDYTTITGMCILKAIHDKMPQDLIFKTIKDQAKDNRAAIINIIGEDLYYEILEL
jgi:predicted regulator of amino acid metabolism with ACT domain